MSESVAPLRRCYCGATHRSHGEHCPVCGTGPGNWLPRAEAVQRAEAYFYTRYRAQHPRTSDDAQTTATQTQSQTS